MQLRLSHPVTRRFAVLWAALIILTGLMFAPQSDAQERNLVIFGDSVIADPPVGDYLGGRLAASSAPGSAAACPTSNNNYGVRAAHKLGLSPWDYACSGTTSISPGPQFATQVDRALGAGALTPATARVVISSGFNDTYNNQNLSDQDLRNRFVGAMTPQINRIRAAAPNARIQIVGYGTITTNDHICLVHVGGNLSDRTPAPQVGHWERQAQNMQIDLARATGVEFVDLKPSTVDRGMCGPDQLRGWAGLVDFHAGPGNLPFHLTSRGHEHVANVIAGS